MTGPGIGIFADTLIEPSGMAFNAWPIEPQAMVAQDVAFAAGNNWAARSNDSGQTWTFVNPATRFPASDGGFGGDQRLHRVVHRDINIWLLQYWHAPLPGSNTSRHRLAVCVGRDNLRAGNWYYYDLTPQTFGFAAGLQIDFPDLTDGQNFLYGHANVYTPGAAGTYVGGVLWRVSLAQIAAAQNATFEFFTNATYGNTALRLAQGCHDTLWAGGKWNTTALRLVWWPESAGLSAETKTIATVSSARVTSAGPDGRRWAEFSDHRILGAFLAADLGFVFSSAPVTGRPRGFVRVAKFNTLNRALIGEEDIWNNDNDFLYPCAALSSNRLRVALSLAVGGGGLHPSTGVLIVDDLIQNFGGQTILLVQQGNSGPLPGGTPALGRWGDYLGLSAHPTYGNTWVAASFALNGGPAPANTDVRYVWFGRQRDEPTWVDVQVSATWFFGTLNPTIQIAEADRFGRQGGTASFARSYPWYQDVNLAAPARIDTPNRIYTFDRWVRNGFQQPVGVNTLLLNTGFAASTVEARYAYVNLYPTRVASSPMNGVAITVSLPDEYGQGNGTTPFTRTYRDSTSVTLTAPAVAGTESFSHWLVDGVPQTPSVRQVQLVSGQPHDAIAVYGTRVPNGTYWAELTPAVSPPYRSGLAMAFDSRRGRMVLFGGGTPTTWLADTWEFDGTTWTQRTPATSPPGRREAAMAYDSARGKCVLFGGEGLGGSRNDTWEWDGTNWTQRLPATSPAVRFGHGMTFHAQTGRMIMFGGLLGVPPDTWEWDGTNWTQRAPANSPSARAFVTLTYDGTRARTVLYGGLLTSGAYSGETWEWNGSDWTFMTPATTPGARGHPGIAFDALRSRLVVFGGTRRIFNQNVLLQDTWEWDGTDWVERTPALSPTARNVDHMTFDSARGRIVMAGANPTPRIFETWSYGAACDVVGQGHAGGGLSCQCTTVPVIGAPFCLGYPSAQSSAFTIIGLAPPLRPPIPLGPPTLCASGFVHAAPLLVVATPGNPAAPCFLLPADATLIGAGLCLQGLALQTGFCLRATDAVVATIQAR